MKKVSRKSGLPNVGKYTDWPNDKLDLCEAIKENIRQTADQIMPGVEVFFAEPNTFKLGDKYGFSFGVSKFDKNFTERLNAYEFRYKDKELFKTVAKVIRSTPELSGDYRWGRGMGVFVVNMFLE